MTAVRKFTGDEIVIATHNAGKVKELKALFGNRIPTIIMAGDLGLDSPPETENTFVGNAAIKALHAAKASGKPALADDSGLAVEALNGDPGVYTADWAETPGKEGRDWMMAMTKVNDLIGTNPNRKGKFIACFVLAWPDGHYEHVQGDMPGEIVWPPRGEMGFGFDPVFRPEGYDNTFAEMASELKNKISHRAAAFRLMMDKCFS